MEQGCTTLGDGTIHRLGRFISDDPIGLRGGLNLTSYAADNPLRFNDPLGLKENNPNNPSNPNPGSGSGGGGTGGGDQAEGGILELAAEVGGEITAQRIRSCV